MIDILVRVLLMPPMSLIVLIVAGTALRRRWPRCGRALGRLGLAALLVLSTNAGSLLLVRPLERLTAPLAEARASGAQAIVVLAAGNVHAAPEYGGADVPDDVALLRLRYAAHLQHATNLPLLVSGGNAEPDKGIASKASTMARALREDFRTPVAWTEERSADTAQNATCSAAILKAAGVRRVLLVTHAMHMPRAVRAFADAGLEVVPAPTMFYSRSTLSPLMFVPSWSGMFRSHYATHEWIGLAWQWLRRPG
ncbi:YdcF family protein [Massilia atriviolacea]|uniref:YdcF family protein n=1 Tax=Massilia atriviolacea TaxID=2495579 RepID=A0A430HJG3_9BURK|nr:YdcF family protein [Massilia atriviolacea]RSZ57652.1 YdcF family protein [Massilia atriviolacea]